MENYIIIFLILLVIWTLLFMWYGKKEYKKDMVEKYFELKPPEPVKIILEY